MTTVKVKRMKLNNYRCFNQKPEEFQFGETTRISGKNGSGKSTIMNAYLETLTGKMADGTQPDNIRPHDKNGIDIDRIDIIREMDLEINGDVTTITKKTAQKWRKPRGQSEEVFDGNITTYAIDGFETKQKDFQKWQESIAEQDVLLMCSNAKVFLNQVQKSTAEGRKFLEQLSGFKVEDFISSNPEYAHIEEITRGHSIEDALKKFRKDLSAQKKVTETVRTQLAYEKSRNIGDVDSTEIEKRIDDLNRQIEEMDKQEKTLNALSETYDKASREIVELKAKAEKRRSDAYKTFADTRESKIAEITKLQSDKHKEESNLKIAERNLNRAKEDIEYYSDRLKQAQEDWNANSAIEYPEENLELIKAEKFDENSLICPTCGQMLPEEQAMKIHKEFESKKAIRIKNEEDARERFYYQKDQKLTAITESGNKAAEKLKSAKSAQGEAEKKISEIKEKITSLAMEIQKKEKELSEIPDSVDMSDNAEYQSLMSRILQKQSELEKMDNGSSKRDEIRVKRNKLLAEISDKQSVIKKHNADIEEKNRLVSELEEKLKSEGQKCADIERNIDLLINFSIKKNEALAQMINPYFHHFQFVFYDTTIDGNVFETLRIICNGTDYFGGLNRSDQILCEVDLLCGLQKMNGLNLPIWIDNAEAVNTDRLPKIEQQMIILEVTDEPLKVEAI